MPTFNPRMNLDASTIGNVRSFPVSSVREGIDAGINDMRMGQLRSTMAGKLAGDPMMQDYSQIDPVAALKMIKGTGKGRPMTEGQRKKYEMMQMKWDEKMGVKSDADAVAQELTRMESEAMDIIDTTPIVRVGEALSPLMRKMYPARNLYERRSKKKWKSSSTDYIDQKFAQTKEGRAVDEDKRQDAKFAQDNDRATIKAFIDRYKKKLSSLMNIGAALPWAKRASTGDPLAAKNFMAALSRAGSDEALSDSERDLLEFADVGNKIEALVDKYVVTGQQFSANTLKGAYESAANVMSTSGGEMNKLLDDLAKQMTSTQGKNIVNNYRIKTSVPSIGDREWNAASQGQGGDVAPGGTTVKQTTNKTTPRTYTPVQTKAKKKILKLR